MAIPLQEDFGFFNVPKIRYTEMLQSHVSDLEPYSPNAVKKRKDISDGVMESWSVESSVWSPNPITPVFQYSHTPTFGSGYAGLGNKIINISEEKNAWIVG